MKTHIDLNLARLKTKPRVEQGPKMKKCEQAQPAIIQRQLN